MAKGEKLSAKEELFCKLYSSSQFFGNGTRAYAQAYGKKIDGDGAKKKYKIANVEAVHLLAKPSIRQRVTELLNTYLQDNIVDGELAKIIMQDDELPAKVQAIREYNRVKKRVEESPNFNLFKEPDAETKALIEKRFKMNMKN